MFPRVSTPDGRYVEEEFMGKVIYWMNTSIDGYIEDSSGALDFMQDRKSVV